MTRIISYTGFALIAFAFNSILCRLALQTSEIDAASFTLVRLVSGAVTLAIIYFLFADKKENAQRGNFPSAFFLFAYAVCFSFAYVSLTAGTGALILFGSVQATMIVNAVLKGERPKIFEWLGLFCAFAGLIYLVFPGLAAPPLSSSALMTAAGISWGFYTLRGKKSANPLADTAGNFVRAVPLAVPVFLLFWTQTHSSAKGIFLAVLSGAIASGIGYAVWYAALKYHTATRAAILQLSVPALTALGGVLFLSETISTQLLAATAAILGGIALAIISRRQYDKKRESANI